MMVGVRFSKPQNEWNYKKVGGKLVSKAMENIPAKHVDGEFFSSLSALCNSGKSSVARLPGSYIYTKLLFVYTFY